MALTVAEGSDTYCRDSLQTGRMATGLELVAQRLYHRLTTPVGTLLGGEDEANFGEDLAAYVGSTDQNAIGAMLPVRVENIIRRDPVVAEVDVTAVRTVAGGEVSWDLTIDVATTLGPVTLIVAVSDVSVDLLGVR